MEDYKERLSWAMTRAGLTTQQLADRIECTYQAVKKVQDGKSGAFSAERNAKAAAALGVDSNWLVTGKGSPEGQNAENDLESALAVLGQQLQRTPSADDRADIGAALNNLALRGGLEAEQRKVFALFTATKRKRVA